jgi:phage gp37-like protein
MSTVLLDQALAYIRSQFTKAEVVQVLPYAGEFNSGEMDKVSYTCPAIFVTVLGWKPLHNGHRLSGKQAREVRVAAFVVAKHAKRDSRMRLAMSLAEKLAIVLRDWMPTNTGGLPITIGPLEDDASCENLYSQAVDKAGQAVWLVDWAQAVKPIATATALMDWLRVDIEDTARIAEPTVAVVVATPLIVTEKITFSPN